jgi:hypothetical protein
VIRRYGVALNVGRGYDGWSSIKRAADRYYGRQAEGVETTGLYFGDFDPSCEDVHRSLQERFATLGVYPEIPKVALTHEDAQALPGDVVKADDSRAPAFVAKYGILAVELDALPVAELRRRIQEEIERRLDMDALAENYRIEQVEQRELREGIDRIFEDNGQVPLPRSSTPSGPGLWRFSGGTARNTYLPGCREQSFSETEFPLVSVLGN